MTDQEETLTLKWRTVKGWKGLKENSVVALQKWCDLGTSYGAMTQARTIDHQVAICEAIDVISGNGGTIWNDWEGEIMTAEQAKDYVMGGVR